MAGAAGLYQRGDGLGPPTRCDPQLHTSQASDPRRVQRGRTSGLSLPALDGGGSPGPVGPECVSPEGPQREREGHPEAGMGRGGGATLAWVQGWAPGSQDSAGLCSRSYASPRYRATTAFRPCSTAASSRKLTGWPHELGEWVVCPMPMEHLLMLGMAGGNRRGPPNRPARPSALTMGSLPKHNGVT